METQAKYRKCRACGAILPLDAQHFKPRESCRGGYEPKCLACRPKAKTTSSADISLTAMPDSVIVAELRRRGYKGEISRMFTIAL